MIRVGKVGVTEHHVCEVKLDEEQLSLIFAGLELLYHDTSAERRSWRKEGDMEAYKVCQDTLNKIYALRHMLYDNTYYE